MDETAIKVSPRARRVARELGVDLSELSALGKTAIHEEDVRALAAQRHAPPPPINQPETDVSAAPSAAPASPPRPPSSVETESEAGVAETPDSIPSSPPLHPPLMERGPGGEAPAMELSSPPGTPPESEEAETAPDDLAILAEGAAPTVREAETAAELTEAPQPGETATELAQERGERRETEPAPVSPPPAEPPAGATILPPAIVLPPALEEEFLPITPIRRVIADRALASAREIPQFSLWMDIEAESLLASAAGDAARQTAAWVLAVARSLRTHRRLNASYAPEGIRLHAGVHIAVTVPLPDGIVAPVLHDADRKSLDDLQAELRDLEERAHSRRLRGEQLSGATFTVSDWSAFGVRGGIPLIHPPQAATLGIGAPHDTPRLAGGALQFRPTSQVVLVADQRALDPAHAAAFLTALKQEVEVAGW